MHINTLESSHLQELWKHVEGINENKTPVTKARDFFFFLDHLLFGKANGQYPEISWLKFVAGDN